MFKRFKYFIKENDTYIYNISTAFSPLDNTLIFAKKYDDIILKNLKKIENSFLILSEDYLESKKDLGENNYVVFSKNPRAEFYRILKLILKENKKIVKEKNIKIGQNTIIDKTVVLGTNIKIGNNCIIEAGVKIRDNTEIGNNCYIGENSVISGEGIGVDFDEKGIRYNSLHIGGVIIGDNVEIGPLCNIVSGRLEPTIIKDNVIIGGSAYIAHDAVIGKNTLINVRAVICGKVIIGENVEIGPNATVSDNLIIKDNSKVTLGSTVVSKVRTGETVTGNFAVPHNKFLKIMKFLLLNSEE